MSDAERRSAIVLFDEHAADLHRYLVRRAGREAAADVLVDTLLSPAAADDRPRLFGIATGLLRDRAEIHDPDDPLSVGLAALPDDHRDALLLAARGDRSRPRSPPGVGDVVGAPDLAAGDRRR